MKNGPGPLTIDDETVRWYSISAQGKFLGAFPVQYLEKGRTLAGTATSKTEVGSDPTTANDTQLRDLVAHCYVWFMRMWGGRVVAPHPAEVLVFASLLLRFLPPGVAVRTVEFYEYKQMRGLCAKIPGTAGREDVLAGLTEGPDGHTYLWVEVPVPGDDPRVYVEAKAINARPQTGPHSYDLVINLRDHQQPKVAVDDSFALRYLMDAVCELTGRQPS